MQYLNLITFLIGNSYAINSWCNFFSNFTTWVQFVEWTFWNTVNQYLNTLALVNTLAIASCSLAREVGQLIARSQRRAKSKAQAQKLPKLSVVMTRPA